MSRQAEKFDLIIAGGGTTGMSLALSLLKSTRLRIAIVEAHSQGKQELHPGFDSRSVALAAKSMDLLAEFGISSANDLGCPIEHIHVSDKGHLGQCRMHAQDYNFPCLGKVVELHLLGKHLFAEMKQVEKQQLTWLCPDTIANVEQQLDCVSIETKNGVLATAKLLVIAEGGNSPTRKLLNFDVSEQNYQQVALIANVGLNRAHQNWAFERFTPHGPLAMLPLCSVPEEEDISRCSLVWTLDASQKEEIADLNDAALLSRLQEAFGYRLGKLTKIGQRNTYPLSLIQCRSTVSQRTVVVGNAAQSLHPIAGQGLNLTLRDIECLRNLLLQAIDLQQDIGSFMLLQEYQKQRLQDKKRVVTLTDGLVRMFSNAYLPLVVGRNIGLSMMNLTSNAKRRLAIQAMGLNANFSQPVSDLTGEQ